MPQGGGGAEAETRRVRREPLLLRGEAEGAPGRPKRGGECDGVVELVVGAVIVFSNAWIGFLCSMCLELSFLCTHTRSFNSSRCVCVCTLYLSRSSHGVALKSSHDQHATPRRHSCISSHVFSSSCTSKQIEFPAMYEVRSKSWKSTNQPGPEL